MKKGLIFIGPARSGKSRAADKISCRFKHSITIYTNRIMNSSFPFNSLNENTELLILEDLDKLEYINNFLGNGLKVDKQGKKGFTIDPQIIIICDPKITISDFTEESPIFRYFEIVQFPLSVDIDTISVFSFT